MNKAPEKLWAACPCGWTGRRSIWSMRRCCPRCRQWTVEQSSLLQIKADRKAGILPNLKKGEQPQ